MKERELHKRFNLHKPNEAKQKRCEEIRSTAKDFARLIGITCPESRERALAMTKIEESLMWAIAAIVRNE
ncbi:hypothetical protein KAR91_21885 [Candidatus Pacearchaeota archaeon]|nr:hypothetical protein [Candidatus Pacearchaeota archaeon]